jgi:hypothetical protein
VEAPAFQTSENYTSGDGTAEMLPRLRSLVVHPSDEGSSLVYKEAPTCRPPALCDAIEGSPHSPEAKEIQEANDVPERSVPGMGPHAGRQ